MNPFLTGLATCVAGAGMRIRSVGVALLRLAGRQGATSAYLLVSEVVAPGVLEELLELSVVPGVVVPLVPEPAAPPDVLLDASELGVLEPEVPEPDVAGGVAGGVVLSVELAGGVVPDVPLADPLVDPVAESVAAGEEDDWSAALLQPVAAKPNNAARNSTFDA